MVKIAAQVVKAVSQTGTGTPSRRSSPGNSRPPIGAEMSIASAFTRFANSVASAAGKPVTFVLCCVAIIAWGASGPLFGFSDTWQLVINTGTTIVTFLMVFLIQNTQNRDGAAIQAKLDELIRATERARNQFVGLEHLTEEEVEQARRQCEADADAEDGHAPEAFARSFDRVSNANRHR
jgi:low affinity Fe/Cu permease